MDLFSTDLDALSIGEIESFLAIAGPEEQRPAEGVKLDYKLKEGDDLAETVAAFANTSGGLVFVGVHSTRYKHNVPDAIPGAAFAGGDVKARLIGKIISQVTPRPDVDMGVVQVSTQSSDAVAVIRVREGSFPPYQFTSGDKVRIPIRLQDTNRQATLRDIEQLFGKRASFAQTAEERVQHFLHDSGLHPTYMPHFKAETEAGQYGRAYHTWAVQPRLPLRLRLDRHFDKTFKEMITAHFADTGIGQFWPPIVSGRTHIVRWQAGVSGGIFLRLVRHFECTSTGELRFSERIDRHDTGQPESISDLFIGSLRFLSLVESFYRTQDRIGSLSVLHLVDCQSEIDFLATFPDHRGKYRETNAIVFDQNQMVSAKGRSIMVQEVENLESTNRVELVCDFMLGHLRQLCQASVDYESLKQRASTCPIEQTCLWTA